MEGILRVTPEKLISTSDMFQTTGTQVKNITHSMVDLIKALNPIWQGEAASAYTTKFNALQDDMDRIDRMITEHIQDLKEMATQYQNAEKINIDNSNALNDSIIE